MKKNNNNQWVNFIKNILRLLGLYHVWENQHTFNVERLKCVIQVKLEQQYRHYWDQIKNTKHRLEFYNKFAPTEYRMEPYIIKNSNKTKRRNLTKLRISSHRLGIEIGRYQHISKADRLCNTCDDIDDELHFLDTCSKYNSVRNEFINDMRLKYKFNIKTPSDCMMHDELHSHLACYLNQKEFINLF